jgi:hypothetical protein
MPTFYQFRELPAELRVEIWDIVLQNEKTTLDTQKGHATQLSKYDPTAGTIAIATLTRYPVLFEVTREARYDAAKLDGCKWFTIYSPYHGTYGPVSYDTFEVCINFSRDLIYIPELFLKLQQRNYWASESKNPEHYILKTLARILDAETINHIRNISISTSPPSKCLKYMGDDSWWRGEGLDMFCLGRLKNVHLFSIKRGHAEWAKLQVEDYLQWHWVDSGWKAERPRVTVRDRRGDCIRCSCYSYHASCDACSERMLESGQR